MKVSKKNVLKLVCSITKKNAELNANSACASLLHQPKAPKALDSLKKK